MTITIERYTVAMRRQWDDFVLQARNATFLFLRDYMDYHADRFTDFSLIARNPKGNIIALLPANIEGDTLVSHHGLTYGGWLGTYKDLDILSLIDIQRAATSFLLDNGIRTLIYKPIPFFYCPIPSQEDLYLLFRLKAQREVVQISSTINLTTDCGPDYERRRKAKVAARNGLTVSRSDNFDGFWQILDQVLADRHNTHPVHTLEEMQRLVDAFPQNIRLYTVNDGDTLLAGTVVYICGQTVHSQYIAGTPQGRAANAIVLLHDELLRQLREEGFIYFDFGTSNEQAGWYLNEGLVHQKISLGGRGTIYETYRIDLQQAKKLLAVQ